MKLEVKVILLALFAALVPVAIIASLIFWKTGDTGKRVDKEVNQLVQGEPLPVRNGFSKTLSAAA